MTNTFIVVILTATAAAGQQSWVQYYSDPTKQGRAQIILKDTTITSPCFNLECFEELESTYTRIGPFPRFEFPNSSPAPAQAGRRTEEVFQPALPAIQLQAMDPHFFQGLPPLEVTIENIPVMLELSKYPLIRVSDGHTFYSFLEREDSFQIENSLTFKKKAFGLSKDNILRYLWQMSALQPWE